MNNSNLTYGVIGLGYVGLPLCVIIAEAGFNVIAFDVNTQICENLNKGISHIQDISTSRLDKVVKEKLFFATTDFELIKDCKVISICVPTPLNKQKDPDLSFVVDVANVLKKQLCKGQIVILESTTYPGTTREILVPVLQESGLIAGLDFYVCFSPERVDPGNQTWNTKNTPKIIGGYSSNCSEAGYNVYSKIFDHVIIVENADAAELIKVYENTFRLINIALANELSLICDRLNLNVWDIIEAASSKPFGFMKFTPGPGLGGHCIPLDPHYLAWKMKTLSFKTRMIDVASEINSEMPNRVVDKIGNELNKIKLSFNGANVLILGVAYKKDIDDLRESPALDIIANLQEKGCNVSYHDPYCLEIKNDGHTKISNLPLKSVDLHPDIIKKNDLVAIITDHTNIDYQMILENANLIIDTRGVFKKNDRIN